MGQRANSDDGGSAGVQHKSRSDDTVGGGQPGSITVLLADLQRRDAAALTVLWQRFFPRLTGLAQRTLANLPRCSADADDVAQGAFLSFWQALDRGREFQLGDRDDLWNLLGVLTVRKAHKLVRAETVQKRGGGRVLSETALPDSHEDDGRLDQLLTTVSPMEFDMFCEEMLQRLDEDARRVAVLRLQGHSTAEIAELIGQHQRAVQRSLEATRAVWRASAGVRSHLD